MKTLTYRLTGIMKKCNMVLSGIIVAVSSLVMTSHVGAQSLETPETIDIGIPTVLFDKKTMPGHTCQPYIGAQTADFNHYIPYLQNVSNETREVSCPIVRDKTNNANATFGAALTGNNAGGVIFCALYSYDEFGNSQDLSAVSISAVGDFTAQFDTTSSPLAVSTGNGIYAIYCNVTAGSQIYSYRWAEFPPTDVNN